MNISVKHTGIEQNWDDCTTNYWFAVSIDGGEPVPYALSDCCGDVALLDSNGNHVELDNNDIYSVLLPHYEAILEEFDNP